MVPLILFDPLRQYPVREVSAQVRLTDVMPTIADRLGVSIERPIDGTSLLPLLRGTETEDRMALVGQTKVGPRRVGLRGMGFKYIATVGPGKRRYPLDPTPPKHQLYDLNADPEERRNLAEARPELAATLREFLENQRQGLRGMPEPELSDPVDPSLRERLRSLGYIQ